MVPNDDDDDGNGPIIIDPKRAQQSRLARFLSHFTAMRAIGHGFFVAVLRAWNSSK